MSTLEKDIILGEILPRLPVKSLMRFKCVSKSFQTLISSQEFIQFYLGYNSPSSDDLLIIPKDGSIICYDLNSSTPTASFTCHPKGSVFIIGSCNGVLYFAHRILLNPTTRIFQVIRFPDGVIGCNDGIAFDPVNLDFKIVGFSDERDRGDINTRVTKVYSLKTNSCTILDTELDTEFPTDSIEPGHSNGVVFNYYLLHWMFWSPSLCKRRIRCFDVCKMKWTDDVLLPRCYYDPTKRNFLLDIGVLDGVFCSSFENKGNSCFDVWVMMEYGVQDSWFKLFSIPISNNLQGGVTPIASRSGSVEVLFRLRHSSKFYWYNRVDGGMNEAKFDEVPTNLSHKTYMCSRSMVELPGGKLFEDR